MMHYAVVNSGVGLLDLICTRMCTKTQEIFKQNFHLLLVWFNIFALYVKEVSFLNSTYIHCLFEKSETLPNLDPIFRIE